MVKKLDKWVRPHSFIANASTLATGTTIAQAAGVLLAPIITRLYRPEDFGIFSVYTNGMLLLAIVVCLRYEIAIPLAKNKGVFKNLKSLCLIIALIVSSLIGAITFIWKERINDVFNVSIPVYAFWFFAVGLYLSGINITGIYCAVRVQAYKYISQSKVTQSLSQVAVQVLIGIGCGGAIGLFMGDIIGKALGGGMLWVKLRTLNRKSKQGSMITKRRMLAAANRYIHYPMITSGSSLINQAGVIAPGLVIAALYGAEIAGLYALVRRVMALPVDLIGQSIAVAYMGEASKLLRESPDKLFPLFGKTVIGLFIFGLVPTSLLMVFSPMVFEKVFGVEWKQAGCYAQILSIPLLFNLSVSPISQTLNLLQHQVPQLLWDIFRTSSVLGVLLYSWIKGEEFVITLIYYGAVVVLAQILYLMLAGYKVYKLNAA